MGDNKGTGMANQTAERGGESDETNNDSQGLWSVSALDGRYHNKIKVLGDYCSEAALILYRTQVECAWVLHLSEQKGIRDYLALSEETRTWLKHFVEEQRKTIPGQVKAIEAVTNHDVKAVEYLIQKQLQEAGVSDQVRAFVHFACTSEDINNLSYALMCRDLREHVILPQMDELIRDLCSKASSYAEVGMLSRTHGQTASPTTLGREFAVFAHRLLKVRTKFRAVSIEGKMNGAVGNYNAHLSAFPELPWPEISRSFIEEKLGLTQNPLTTQIENHDSLIDYTSLVAQFNTILIGLCRDVWSYISIGYFKQTVKKGEVGSSTMPHKVNPIDFENAEGNFGVANSLGSHFAEKLPISRWQRDLTDSTVLRTLGTYFGHSLLAWKSLKNGLGKIVANEPAIAADLNEAWEVLAEPFQTVMRKYGMVDAYDHLKEATRGKAVTKEALHELIESCTAVPKEEVARLKALRPEAYIGLAKALTLEFVAHCNQSLS